MYMVKGYLTGNVRQRLYHKRKPGYRDNRKLQEHVLKPQNVNISQINRIEKTDDSKSRKRGWALIWLTTFCLFFRP